ncbi:MAG: molybdopterin converting factor subunit 1 [Thalassotalea sp.]|nr:molybdopterin converting factor subunit 1 [Thalassotalea sp.]MDG2392958.1 molybdopterin converting factor subunit 1 [Thalassotalea sp.]
MTIKVLFFAAFKEQLNCEQLELDAANVNTIAEIQELLSTRGEAWQKVFATTSILSAVNHTMVDSDYAVKSGDEVAFFPPVTGG